jgi:hypothetical protein
MRLGKARTLTVAGVAVAAGATTAGLLASSATAAPAASAHSQSGPSYQVRDVLYGWNMKHKNSHTGKSEELSDPSGLAQYGGNLYASFTNGVGAQGQASASGNLDSTIVEFTAGGSVVAQWDVAGQAKGLTANPATSEVIATVNPAGNSSLYSIEPGGQVIHYAYNQALASKGGTGEATYDGSQLLITASQPTAPAWSSPAVYSVSLDQTTKVATIKAFYWDNSPAKIANDPGGAGDPLGTNVTLGLSPSSISVLGSTSPRFAKHVVVSSGSSEVIGTGSAGLWDLKTAAPVGDVVVVTQWNGDVYATNPVTDTVNVFGANKAIWPGTVFVVVNPGTSSAKVEQLNLQSGQLLSSYGFWGVSLQPQDLLYVPGSAS